ncbi:helix-turn-helix domain-containing protein [Pandoraea apista]|uniref:XRE family transcriptional regulator n=1 Tax=Pandoraea apista TaxID=93218 RepID=A0ABX9ZPW7_9BURK|nr:helix-turn-helix transcriptional regulator [Pandoraea apista]RRJ34808.1 XRE family transcriptional regulator [Pandoraea apista]RRJ80890.1 XRE family transcriptional regulator [Pandoraea apista]RSD16892.1 XRE family transcriptional regulator [Pandoraea apista]RSD20992.1 XRE family transcriptional regulator [Pandoraea apista]RSK77591.1 XRE family transcriptional regulator [Pandoraea apista]
MQSFTTEIAPHELLSPSPTLHRRPRRDSRTTWQAKHSTPKQLAARLGKPEAFALDYESGKYRLDFPELVDIADALVIDVVELVNLCQQRI